MKLTKHDGKTLMKTRKQGRHPKGAARSAERAEEMRRCEELGLKHSTVMSRMKRHGCSFEEALVRNRPDPSVQGRIGKRNSPWAETTPGSPAQRRQATGPKGQNDNEKRGER